MKILIVTPEYPPLHSSGIGNVVYQLKEELENIGIPSLTCSTLCADIELCNGPLIERFVSVRSIYIYLFWRRANQYIRENKYDEFDIIWVHDPLPTFLINLPPNRNFIVTFHTIHSFFLQHSKYPKFVLNVLRRLEIKSLKQMDKKIKIITVSLQVMDELESLGVEKERLSYIPNGVDTELFKPRDNKRQLRKKFDILPDDQVILSLGRMSNQKQPLKLIDLFVGIGRELKEATLVVAGGGRLLDEFKHEVKIKKMENVNVLGFVPEVDKPDLYSSSDFYIMTSKYEGLPLTLLEAMSSGLPCIVSDIPNLRIVEDARCGIIVDFDSMDESVKKVSNFLRQDNTDSATRARKYSITNLSWKIIAKRYKEIFESVLSK